MAYDEIYTRDDLIARIKMDLKDAADFEEIRIPASSAGHMLGNLLKGLSKKHGVGVVILVDEYDAPVTKHIPDRKLAEANRDVLHDFYQSIKTNIDYIHFAFVTGITRFAMTAMDSGPNNFLDISLMPEFAGICGFTPSELNACFKDRFEETLSSLKDNKDISWNAGVKAFKAKLMDYYDGYNWLGAEHILNPYSILNFFQHKKFDTYWPSSGQPSHLRALARENPTEYFWPPKDSYTSAEIRKAELSKINALPILFHSGYLTIDRTIAVKRVIKGKTKKVEELTFKIPNEEVELDYEVSLFNDAFAPSHKYISNISKKFPNALLKRNSDEVERLIHDILSSVSFYQHPTSNELAISEQLATSDKPTYTEKNYHAILHASFLSAGFEVYSQGAGAHGRNDIVLFLNKKLRVVIELKYCKTDESSKVNGDVMNPDNVQAKKHSAAKELSAALDRAEKQVIKQDYAGPYRAANCKVICMALALRNRDQVAVRFFDY
jgi:hypothetical protein